MKRTIKLFGIAVLVMAIVFGMAAGFAACSDGSTSEHTHDFSGDWKSNATQHWKECAKDGVKGLTANHTPADGVCSVCEYDNTPSHTHEWGEWETTTPATCEADGEETRVCKLDGTVEKRSIDKDPDAHVWGAWDTAAVGYEAPTCTETGKGTRVCTVCGVADPNTVIAALGHDWGEWEITTPATCTEDGEETRVCSHDADHTETQVIPMDEDAHDWEWKQTTAATFIAAGEETETCKHDPSHTNGTRPIDPLPITTSANWTTALTQLSGKTGEYTLTISVGVNGIGVAGRTDNNFGNTTTGSLKVTLKGSGRLYLNSQGNLLRIGERQTLVIDSENLTLQGRKTGQNSQAADNNTSVVYVNTGGTLELQNGTVSGNTCTNNINGGGVYVNSSGTFTMHGGEITNNATTGDTNGGGVYVYNNGTFTMKGGEITKNTTPNNGGGVYVYSNITFTMEDGKISGNDANRGGGVYMNSGTFTMEDGEISKNTVTSYGGGVYMNGGTFTMEDGEISGNTAGSGAYSSGGGVYVTNQGIFTMESGKISGNKATATSSGGGGGVYFQGKTFTIMNGGEISGNTASGDNTRGGGVYLRDGAFRIVTGTIYGTYAAGSLRNIGPSNSAALYIDGTTAERGTYVDGEWVSKGTYTNYYNDTINVKDGEIVVP
jgi:hypothetical protein